MAKEVEMKRSNIKLVEMRKIKRDEALERQVEWSNLTPKQQLQALDRRLGKDVGAQKQRARIEVQRRNAAQNQEAKKA